MEIPYKILAKEPVKVNMGKPAFSGIFRKVVPAGISPAPRFKIRSPRFVLGLDH
jgi:hypothetical protein